MARVHTFRQNLNGQRAADQTTQRRRHPQLIVIAATGVEPDHQLHVAEARCE